MKLFSRGSKSATQPQQTANSKAAPAYQDDFDPPGFDYGAHSGQPAGAQAQQNWDPIYDQSEELPNQQGQVSDVFDAHAEPEAGENFLTAYNIQKTYGSRKVVKGVSLAVRRGQSVGLLGPNGAGKTTVFYMITGLVPADEGRITIDGRDVTRMPMYRRARLGIGYLPQEASIFRGLSVEQNIMAVLELVEPNRKKRKEQLDSLLEEFKITRLRKSPSIALSGGERRRCEIARALASRPSFMLLDEPFAGIDPLAVGDIQDLVRHLTQRGIGVLITDHNVRETLSLIDRAYIIYDGQVLTHGKPEEIIKNDDVRRVYLGDMFG
jgi:lipopolysaccharide export system ATP-binding protein